DLLIQGRPDVATVGQVMEKHPIVVETGTTLKSAVSIMREKRVDSLLIVNGNNELQGYVNIDFIQQHYGKSSNVDEVINTDVLAVNSGSLLRDTIRRICAVMQPMYRLLMMIINLKVSLHGQL